MNPIYFEAVRLLRAFRKVKGGTFVLINLQEGKLSGFLLKNEGLIKAWSEADNLFKSVIKQAASAVLSEVRRDL